LDQTPNSPGIINLTPEQLKDMQNELDKESESSPRKLKRKFDQISSDDEFIPRVSQDELKENLDKLLRGDTLDQET
jgi:polyhydroxyalkanoate synthesis regulator phasin